MTQAVLGPPPPTIPGWFHHGTKILALVEAHRPRVCVELGTWMAASAIPVARAIKRWGGTLTCIDSWSGDIYHGTPGPPYMLLSCARNMIESGVQANVRLIPATTLEAVKAWSEPIDYLYIDADHTKDAVWADLNAWVPHVRQGGLILGDDYENRSFPGVKAAWDRFEQERGIAFTRYQSAPPHPDGVQLIYGFKE